MGTSAMTMEREEARLNATFSALANETRRAILSRLTEGEASVNELAEPFQMSLPAVSKHLKVLERAGLVTRGRHAQYRPCALDATPLEEVATGPSNTARCGKRASTEWTTTSNNYRPNRKTRPRND